MVRHDKGPGDQQDPTAQREQIEWMFVVHTERLLEEIDDQDHDDDLANARSQVVQAWKTVSRFEEIVQMFDGLAREPVVTVLDFAAV